jgi:hypothetical protein
MLLPSMVEAENVSDHPRIGITVIGYLIQNAHSRFCN